MNPLALVLLVLFMGLAFVGSIYVWQERLLYFPDSASVDQMTNAELRAWPSTTEFRGLLAEPAGKAIGTAIVFHGNAGHAGHRAFYAKSLNPLGWRVILAEYPGYGPRSGKLGEASLVTDAAETIAIAHRQFGGPILPVGESLGAGVAAAAAARQPGLLAGVLLITPWDRLQHVASFHYGWLPVKWMLRDQYDSIEHLSRFGRPVYVVVAGNDQVVPARLGQALFSALDGPKQLETIADSGHNDWVARVDPAWWRTVFGFFVKQGER